MRKRFRNGLLVAWSWSWSNVISLVAMVLGSIAITVFGLFVDFNSLGLPTISVLILVGLPLWLGGFIYLVFDLPAPNIFFTYNPQRHGKS